MVLIVRLWRTYTVHSQLTTHHSPLTNKKNAFTLAEVLITLGIIGVVAALTMPTLIMNFQKKAAATRVKQAYSQVLQAIRLSEVDNGPMSDWDYNMSSDMKENNELFMNKYIVPYFKGIELCKADSEGNRNCGASITSNDIRYFLPNGTSLALHTDQRLFYVMIDTNGAKGPNNLGNDKHYFITQNFRLLPHGWFDGITREDVLNGYNHESGYIIECKKSKSDENNPKERNRHGCTALLMLDGWEMKDDYPW